MLGPDRGVLARLQVGELGEQRRDVGHDAEAQAQARTGLVDQVDRLVRQHPVRQVPCAQFDGGADRVVRVRDRVVLLVRGLESLEDAHRVLDRGFGDLHGLEAALEGRILLDPAVLGERGRADQVQVAPGEARLQDVSGVHAAALAGSARTDDRVHLVDEDDDLALVRGDLVHRLGQALLEVAAVAGAREHRGQVERHDTAVLELRGHGAVDDRAGESLDDRGLADAGLADQHRVVLGAAAEDLDGLLDLGGAADHGVELALARTRGEIEAELVEHRRLGGSLRGRPLLVRRRARGHGLAQTLGQGLGGDAGAGEDLARGGVLPEHEREEHVLRLDVGRTRRARHLVGVEQRAAGARGDGRGLDVGGLARSGQAGVDGVDDRLRGHPDVADRLVDGVVLDDRAEDVQRVELGLAALEGEAPCALQDALSAHGEEPAEVDRPGLPGLLTGEVAGEELVERARARVGEVVGHVASSQT